MLQGLQPGDPRVIGPYALVGQLGSGGMGRVFLGRSMGGRLVAVKVIRSDLASDPDFRVRFRREVTAARKVSGLYTAVVVDADADAQEPWLATAYVAGPSLSEAIHDHGPLPPRSALALAAGLAESLVAIHKVGCGAPGSQAVERAAGQGRAAADRLRDLPGGGVDVGDPGGLRHRIAWLYVPRAGPGS